MFFKKEVERENSTLLTFPQVGSNTLWNSATTNSFFFLLTGYPERDRYDSAFADKEAFASRREHRTLPAISPGRYCASTVAIWRKLLDEPHKVRRVLWERTGNLIT